MAQAELCVKGRKCLVVDPDTGEIIQKLLWLPPHIENRRVMDALAPFWVVRFITREKWRCAGMKHMETLNHEVQLTLKDLVTSNIIPYLLAILDCQSRASTRSAAVMPQVQAC